MVHSLERVSVSRRQIRLFLLAILLFGGILRLMLAYDNVHYFDLPYYLTWARDVFHNGVFGAYSSLRGMQYAVDYPPVFLFPLYITGAILEIPAVAACEGYVMLAVKMWQILFDLAIVLALYLLLRRYSPLCALGAATLWCFCPAGFFNSAVWGQTDSLLLFLILVSFGALYRKRPILGAFLYAVACLTKFQAAYFAPVVLLMLFCSGYRPVTLLKAALTAVVTVMLVFLPFMLSYGPTLPVDVFLGGLGKWPYASLYAFNFMGGLGLNYVRDSIPLFFSVSANLFGTGMTVLAVVGTVVCFFTARRRCPFVLGFLLMDTIFIFASRMHERYQLPVLILLLAAAALHKSGRLLVAYLLTSCMVFLNQYLAFTEIVYRDSAPAPWMAQIDGILIGGSVLNLLVYLFSLWVCLDFLYDLRGRLARRRQHPTEEGTQLDDPIA